MRAKFLSAVLRWTRWFKWCTDMVKVLPSYGGQFILDENTWNGATRFEIGSKEEKEQFELEIVNRMLRNITEDLCWLSKPYPYCWKDMSKCDMINRLPKAYFSNKVGLANSLAHLQWYYEEGVCTTQYPRTYNISLREDYDALQDDFRLTACVSLLKWLTGHYNTGGTSAVRSADGRVDTNSIEFALKRCMEYVRFKEHEDIDMEELPHTWDHQWEHFLTQYYQIVNENHLLREAKEDPPITTLVGNAQNTLNLVMPYWCQMDLDGINNWWIVKPGGRCCGNGILIRNHLDHILDIVNPSITRETRYVVQKYIERPLLIYNTKFDIRQWFLVTNVYPLTIWMYKESYLRFCSSTFNLKNMHESIHLCNNAVQRRYKNGKRDTNLPDENMWDCYTFQTHLKAIGHPTAWDDIIYPGMRESFVGAILASQDTMERRRNCFELYGADFMITEQIVDGPWLIEINSNPAMDSSTSVTARMCPQVLEDIIKVVVDRRNDKNALTGAFELAFKQNCPPIPPYLGMSLSIRGRKIYRANEGKKMNRPNFNQPSSESDDSDSDSEDGNIVQKRCNVDFMQPIKKLREEIANLGQGKIRDDLLNVPSEGHSDSAANETDTSRASTENIALEGKEIHLKKKRLKRRKRKIQGKCDTNKNPKTVDEKPKIKINVVSEAKSETDTRKPSIERTNIVRGYSVFEKSNLTRSHESLESYKYSKSLKTFPNINPPQGLSATQTSGQHPIIITDLWEPISEATEQKTKDNSKQSSDDKRFLQIDKNSPSSMSRTMSLCSLQAESDKNLSTSPGEHSDTSPRPPQPYHYETKLERVLRQLECSDKRFKCKYYTDGEDISQALSITSPEIKDRQRTWKSTKASVEYFREWKYKIDETRKNCEDMLTKLRYFKENNSKIKFQDILRKRVEEEARNLQRMNDCRVGKKSSKWNLDSTSSPLNITSASGAVVHVSDGIPKVKLRNRPLIPAANASRSSLTPMFNTKNPCKRDAMNK